MTHPRGKSISGIVRGAKKKRNKTKQTSIFLQVTVTLSLILYTSLRLVGKTIPFLNLSMIFTNEGSDVCERDLYSLKIFS